MDRGIVRGAVALASQGFAQRLIGMASSVVLARGLGVTDFGAYTVVQNTGTSAYGLVRLGVDASLHVTTAEATPSEASKLAKEEYLGAGLVILGAAGLAAAIGCIAGAHWIADRMFERPDLTNLLRLAGLIAAIQCMSQFCYATLAGLRRFGGYAKVMSAGAVASFALAVAGMIAHGLNGALYGVITGQLLTAAALGVVLKSALRESALAPKFSHLRASSQAVLRIGFPFYLSGLVAVPVTYYLQSLLARSQGLEGLGHLRIITAITAIVTFLPISISPVNISALAGISSAVDREKFTHHAWLNFRGTWLLTLSVAAMLFATMPWLIHALFGAEYAAATPAARLAVMSAVFLAGIMTLNGVLMARRRFDLLFVVGLMQSLLFLGLSFVLIPLGVIGYFAAEFIAGLATLAVSTIVIAQRQRMRRLLLPSLVLGMVPVCLLGGLSFSGMPQVWLALVSAAVVLASATYGWHLLKLNRGSATE